MAMTINRLLSKR